MNDYDPTFKSFNSKAADKSKSHLNPGMSRGANKLVSAKDGAHLKGLKKPKGYSRGMGNSRKNYVSIRSQGNSFFTNPSNHKTSKNLKMAKLIDNKVRKNSIKPRKGRSSSLAQERSGKTKPGKKKMPLNVSTHPTEGGRFCLWEVDK